MDSQSFAGILGALVAAVVLVVAFAYGPMGPFGKSTKPAAPAAADRASSGSAWPAGAGDQGSAQLVLIRQMSGHPLADWFGHPYLACNGDVELESSSGA